MGVTKHIFKNLEEEFYVKTIFLLENVYNKLTTKFMCLSHSVKIM